VAAYLLVSSSDENEISPEELLPPENKPAPTTNPTNQLKQKPTSSLPLRRFASVPATLALRAPIGGYAGWAVAMNVLELRF
jgi:hypothetical protein